MSGLEATIVELANVTQLLFEAASVLVVAAGGVAFAYAVVAQRFTDGVSKPRRTLARFLVIALELQLAADIIATATHPTFDELLKLGAIAIIRTFLNYFLVLEMREDAPAKTNTAERSG